MNDTIAPIRNMTNKIFAIPAAPAAMPPQPNTAAIKAITRKRWRNEASETPRHESKSEFDFGYAPDFDGRPSATMTGHRCMRHLVNVNERKLAVGAAREGSSRLPSHPLEFGKYNLAARRGVATPEMKFLDVQKWSDVRGKAGPTPPPSPANFIRTELL
jgi:hypothetical protein